MDAVDGRTQGVWFKGRGGGLFPFKSRLTSGECLQFFFMTVAVTKGRFKGEVALVPVYAKARPTHRCVIGLK